LEDAETAGNTSLAPLGEDGADNTWLIKVRVNTDFLNSTTVRLESRNEKFKYSSEIMAIKEKSTE
jgi:hypothetical protein